MGQVACQSACLRCTMSAGPAIFSAVPPKKSLSANMPVATIMHNKPFVNIMPFPGCVSLLNPTVVPPFVPMGLCVPVIPAPWFPGSPKVLVQGQPILNKQSKLACSYGGVITFAFPGQMTVKAS